MIFVLARLKGSGLLKDPNFIPHENLVKEQISLKALYIESLPCKNE